MGSLPATLQISKGDIFQVDPLQLVIDESKVFTGRWKPVTEETVRERAESFLEVGQQQPCRVRLLSGKGATAVYGLVAGFTRGRAAILLSTDPDLRAKAGLEDDKSYPLKVIRSTCNAEGAVIENLVENAQRKETSDVDDAHNHAKMRELGYIDADIVRILGMEQSKVSKLKRILALEDRFKDQLHNREISLEIAMGLLDIDPAKRDEIITPDPESPEVAKPTRERVKKAQREAGVSVKRTPKDIRTFCTDYTQDECQLATDETTDAVVKGIIKEFHMFIDGEIEEGVLLDSLVRLVEG